VNPRPTPKAARAWSFPQVHRAHLENGLTVATIPLPGKTLCAADLVLDAGASTDAIEGTANLLARAFNEGTTKRNAAEFADASESLGMQLSATAGWDALTLSLSAPKSRLAQSLELMAEAAWTPAIPDEGFDRIKKERLVQIEQEKANPDLRASTEFPKHAYTPDSVYSRAVRGTIDSVSSLTRTHLVSAHEQFVSPGSATLVVAGDVEHDWVVEQASRAFGGFNRPEADRKSATTTSAIDSTRIVLVDRPGSVQTNLVIGHKGIERTHPDLDGIRVASYVLGGSFTSRINQRLREELGLTYGARGSFDLRRAPGPFQVQAPVQASGAAQSISETLAIIENFREHGLTDEELKSAIDYLRGVFPLRFETADAVAGAVSELAIFGLPDDELFDYPARIAAVTKQQASEAARKHLNPSAMLIIAVGPAEQILNDLEKIAPTTVVSDL
jgi:zinc protease